MFLFTKSGSGRNRALLLAVLSLVLVVPLGYGLLLVGLGGGENKAVLFYVSGTLGFTLAVLAIILTFRASSISKRSGTLALAILALIPHGFAVAIALFVGSVALFAPSETKITPLHKAVMKSDLAAAEAALANNQPLESPTSLGRSPLAIAVRNADAPMVRLLLKHGANPNGWAYVKCGEHCDLRGPLILHAIDVNSPEIVNFLLEHGASVNAVADWHIGNVMHIAMSRRTEIKRRAKISPAERKNELNKSTLIASRLVEAGFARIPKKDCVRGNTTVTYFRDRPELLDDKNILEIICID